MLPARHHRAGLDALCRAYRANPRPPQYHLPGGFLNGHRGAGLLACCRLLEDGLVEPASAAPIAAMVEREWTGNEAFAPLFAPFPAEAAAQDALPRLVRAFAGALGVATGDPHSSIFPALALRDFTAHPHLATPGRLEGLLDMARLDTADPPQPQLPELPQERARFDAGALSDDALREFAHALTAYPTYDNSYCGHILTWAVAIIDLHACGQDALGRLAERSWRNYLKRGRSEGNPFAGGKTRAAPPAEEQWPESARFWSDRPDGNLEGTWAHLPKYAHAALALTRRARDAQAAATARALYHLVVY